MPVELFILAGGSRPERFLTVAEWAVTLVEAIGIAIVVIGASYALLLQPIEHSRGHWKDSYPRLRRRLGRAILLGLEFLVAADIISTVLITPTLESAATLGLIVLIRTFLAGRWSLRSKDAGRGRKIRHTAQDNQQRRRRQIASLSDQTTECRVTLPPTSCCCRSAPPTHLG